MAEEVAEKLPENKDESNAKTEGIVKKPEESNAVKAEEIKKIDEEAKNDGVSVKKEKDNVKQEKDYVKKVEDNVIKKEGNMKQNEDGKRTPTLSPRTDKGAESDLPDDFFDDFGKDEFMSALEVVDSFDSFDECDENDGESNKEKRIRTRGLRTRYKIDNRPLDKRLEEPESYTRRRPRVETKALEAAVSEESMRIRKKLEEVRQEIAERQRQRKRDSYDRSPLDQRHRRPSPQSRDYHRESERRPKDSREGASRDWRPHESRDRASRERRLRDSGDQTSRERRRHDSGERTSRERRPHESGERTSREMRRHDSGERTSRGRRRSQNRRPIVERDRRRSRSRSPLLVTSARRDISKTTKAILTDKNKKAKDLLEKRVETGLIPPGMETEFDLPSRDRRRSRSNSPEYRNDRHSRLPAASDSHHRSRQRSPFIKELARRLKEKSEERQLVQMLNPMHAPYVQEPPIYDYGPQGTIPYYSDPYGPIPHAMSVPMQSPMPGSMPNPMTYMSPVSYPDPMLYHSSPMTPIFNQKYIPPMNHNLVTPLPAPEIVPAPRPVPKPIPEAPVQPVPPKPIKFKIKKPEPTLDDLLDQRKISVADYLKLNVKSTGTPTPKGQIALDSRIDILSRCQNAVSKLTQFRKPNNLVYDPDTETTAGQSFSAESAAHRSPLQRRQSAKYDFTSPLALTRDCNERLLSNIVAAVGLQGLPLGQRPGGERADNAKDASAQTSGADCEVCEMREKYKRVSVATDTDDLIATESVQSQVTERELQQWKGVPANNSVSLTHLTPQQILAAELATKARSYIQHQQQQQQYSNQQQYYNRGFNQQKNNDGRVSGYGFRRE